MISNANSRFSVAPQANVRRAKFDMSHTHKTTFNTGDLVPIYYEEVLPGDTFSLDTKALVRMTTPIFPVMDNSYLDIYFFFVPNRLVWEHWREFMGENRDGHWVQPLEYEVPQVISNSGSSQGPPYNTFTQSNFKFNISDYFGIPQNVDNLSISSLYFKAYALIWNEFFRDENLQDPCVVDRSDVSLSLASLYGSGDAPNLLEAIQYGVGIMKVSKFHDYFTSALPEAQKGSPVTLPLGSVAPVNFGDYTDQFDPTQPQIFVPTSSGFGHPATNVSLAASQTSGVMTNSSTVPTINAGQQLMFSAVADLSQATAATINSIRLAFQTQRLLERDSRSGSRYTEMLRAHFGVTAPDASLQRPEFLGGKRQQINVQQVLQNSSSTSTSPQGNTAAYSATFVKDNSFTKSFTEHGMIIGLACVRTSHSYQYGIDRRFSRKARLDYYFPVLANIGETAILNKEIYAQGNSQDNEAFGYQEAWAEYRYKNNVITGKFRSNAPGTLDTWHYADIYTSLPILSDAWIKETEANVQRTLAIQDEPQFIADFFFDVKATRPMPLYSIPGFVDHF